MINGVSSDITTDNAALDVLQCLYTYCCTNYETGNTAPAKKMRKRSRRRKRTKREKRKDGEKEQKNFGRNVPM
jgi:hypothetical protein